MQDKPILILAIVMAILASIAVFFIYLRPGEGTAWPPRIEPPPRGRKQCAEPKEYMRQHHMDLLMLRRDAKVREDVLKCVVSKGKECAANVTQTYFGCNSNKTEFCDRRYSIVTGFGYDLLCHNRRRLDTQRPRPCRSGTYPFAFGGYHRIRAYTSRNPDSNRGLGFWGAPGYPPLSNRFVR